MKLLKAQRKNWGCQDQNNKKKVTINDFWRLFIQDWYLSGFVTVVSERVIIANGSQISSISEKKIRLDSWTESTDSLKHFRSKQLFFHKLLPGEPALNVKSFLFIYFFQNNSLQDLKFSAWVTDMMLGFAHLFWTLKAPPFIVSKRWFL